MSSSRVWIYTSVKAFQHCSNAKLRIGTYRGREILVLDYTGMAEIRFVFFAVFVAGAVKRLRRSVSAGMAALALLDDFLDFATLLPSPKYELLKTECRNQLPPSMRPQPK